MCIRDSFKVKPSGSFEHEAEVDRFLDAMTTQNKFPFSTPELRAELKHTFWPVSYTHLLLCAGLGMALPHPAFQRLVKAAQAEREQIYGQDPDHLSLIHISSVSSERWRPWLEPSGAAAPVWESRGVPSVLCCFWGLPAWARPHWLSLIHI